MITIRANAKLPSGTIITRDIHATDMKHARQIVADALGCYSQEELKLINSLVNIRYYVDIDEIGYTASTGT